MKKIIVIMTFVFLSTSVLFYGCSKKTTDNSNSTVGTTESTSTDTSIHNNADNNTNTDTSSNNTSDNNASGNTDNTTSTDTSSDIQTFTADELKKFDGQNGTPAYVAVNGTVYDVTNAKKWNNGSHQGLTAGADLTDALSSSPHGDSVLADLPIVGTME